MTETFYIEREDEETGLIFTVEIQAYEDCFCNGGFDVGGTETHYWEIEDSETKVFFKDKDITKKLKKAIFERVTDEKALYADLNMQIKVMSEDFEDYERVSI